MKSHRNTIRFMFGCSGVGKSTRLKILWEFFQTIESVEKMYINDFEMGYYFPKNKIYLVGKENKKKNSFQGLDAFIGKLGNFERQYNCLYTFCESLPTDSNFIVESVLAMSTHRTGPKYILENEFNVDYCSEFFYYPGFNEFKERISGRDGKNYSNPKEAPIFLKNNQYARKFEVFQSEILNQEHPDRFKLTKHTYDEEKFLFTERFLLSSGKEYLINSFKEFKEHYSAPATKEIGGIF